MKTILSLLLICLPITLFAQTNTQYLEGAVPLKDGKVTFTSEISIPGLSQKQIYETILQWANKRFQPDETFNDRVLYQNPEDGDIVIGGEEYLTFTNTSFSLDRTRIYYMMRISCLPEKCNINITRIRYWYNEARDGGEKYTAEEWITDKYALNKSKTKLYPISGKFRRKTIDLKNELINDINTTFKQILQEQETRNIPKTQVVNQPTSTPKEQPLVALQPATPVQPISQAQPATSDNQESLIAQATRMTITAGNDEQFEISKECWGGFGEFFGKKVAYLLIDTQKTMGNLLMTQSESYKISFFTPDNSQPTLVFNCKKLMSQNINGEEAKKMSPNCETAKSYNMYVGEVLK